MYTPDAPLDVWLVGFDPEGHKRPLFCVGFAFDEMLLRVNQSNAAPLAPNWLRR